MIRAARSLALPGVAVLCTLAGLLLLTSCWRERPAATTPNQGLQARSLHPGPSQAGPTPGRPPALDAGEGAHAISRACAR